MRRLLREPFNMPLDDIAGLTDRQIAELCFGPVDEHGQPLDTLELPGEDAELTREQARNLLFTVGRGMGVPDADLEAQWREQYPDG